MSNTVQGAPSQGYANFAPGAAVGGASGRSGPAWNTAVRTAQGRPDAPASPTSLLSERLGDGASNCLEAATDAAGPGDDLVFLHDNRTQADGNANNAGHVLVRDRATGTVRDPSEPGGKAYADLDAWMAGHTAEGGRPAYSLDGSVSSSLVKDVLSRPPEQRQARIDTMGDPALSRIARRLYDDAPPAPDDRGMLTRLAHSWDIMSQGDDVVSRDDLEKIAGNAPPAWADDAMKDAAHFLLDNPTVFDQLDTAGKGDADKPDGKIDGRDLAAATRSEPLTGEDDDALNTLAANWDALRQGDDKVSLGDLRDVAGDAPPAWANDQMKGAAQYMLDHPDLLTRLDTQEEGGTRDGKIDSQDMGAAMRQVPLSGDDNSALSALAANWDALRQGDDAFNTADLQKIVGSTPPAWANDQIKAAAQHLLSHPELMIRLDTAGKNDSPDGSVNDQDLAAEMQPVPLTPQGEKAIRTLDANWDAMRRGQDTISGKELGLLTGDNPPGFVTPEIKAAAEYLLAHPEVLKFSLDTAGKGGVPDGKFSREDVDRMVSRLPATPSDEVPQELGDDAKAPAFTDYISWGPGPGKDAITYETSEGKFIASKDKAPELYKQVTSDTEAHDAISKATGEGATYALPDQDPDVKAGTAQDLGNEVCKFQDSKGKEYVVARATNSVLYDKALAASDAAKTASADDVRAKHDLPPSGDLNVPDLKTDVSSDPKNPNADKLTVSELATKNLVDDYRNGVDDGSIPKDDPRAKLVRAMEAKSALESGRGITGYTDGSWRDVDDHQTQLAPKDMQDIIKGGDVDHALQTLFQDKTVAKDFSDKTTEAIGHIPDKDGVTQTLEDTLLGKDAGDTRYIDFIKDLKAHGKSDAAQADVSSMVQSLTLLDPEKGKAAAQKLQLDSVTTDLNELVKHPGKISDDNKTEATKDLFGLLKGVLKSGTIDMPRHTITTIEKFVEGFLKGNVDQKKVIEAVQGAAKEAQANGGKIPAASLDKYKAFVPFKDQAGLMGLLGGMNDKGMLGSLGGGIALMSGIYQLTAKGGKVAATPLGRLGVAKDFLSFVGTGAQFIKTGDAIFGALGKGGAVEMLGLSKEVPEIWGKQGLWGKKLEDAHKAVVDGAPGGGGIELQPLHNPGQPGPADHPNTPRTGSPPPDVDTGGNGRRDSLDSIFSLYDNDGRPASPPSAPDRAPPPPPPDRAPPPPPDDAVTRGIAEGMDARAGAAGAPKINPSTAAKIAGSTVKVLGAATDGVGGVADIVLGAFTIKKGVESGNALTQAAGGLQVTAGAAGALAGGLGIAALFGPVAAGAAAATGPLFLIGAAIGGVSALINYFNQHNSEQKATDKEGQWYQDLAGDNLLQGDWADKVEYSRYAISTYGGRDAPDNESMFRYQSAEWDHFRLTDQKYGGSSNRLEKEVHLDYAGDGKNKVNGDVG